MKLQKYFFSLALIILFSLSLFAQTAPDTDDVVGWSEFTFIVPLKKKDENGKRVDQWILNLGGVMRFGRDLKRSTDRRAVVSINYRINKYFTVGTGYLYRWSRLTEAPRQFEHRSFTYLNSEKKWSRATLKNRTMYVYSARLSRPDAQTFRNRTQLSFPLMKDKKEVITPYVTTEPYFDLKNKRWFRNDFFAGVSKQFTPKFGADFFYIRQGINTGAIRTTNGFGISMRYRIDKVK